MLLVLQQKIADRKSKMLCIELDDLRGVSCHVPADGDVAG